AAASSPLRLGMSGPLQGPSQDLGIEMRRGIMARLDAENQRGGLNGRKLEFSCLNDNYDPTLAVENTRQLLNITQLEDGADQPDQRGPNGVLALLGSIGTPTMLATAPIATKNRVVFFAPFTGSQKYLRDGTNSPYVYNFRAGYYDETNAMVDYMANYRSPRIITGPDSYKHLIAFTQKDAYGDAGYDGLVTAYNTRVAALPQPDSTQPNPSIARLYYERESVSSVDPAVEQATALLADILGDGQTRQSVGIVMIDTYQPGNKFIRGVKDWLNQDATRAAQLDVLFMHVSFVGSDSLSKALTSPPESYVDVTDPAARRKKTYAADVMVTQVVPYYKSQASGVAAYRSDLAAFDGGTTSFTSLEGYLAASVLIEGLKGIRGDISSEALVHALDSNMSDIDVGIGAPLSFSSTNHQASRTVWGSVLTDDGTFKVPFMWNPKDKIIPGSE
ncbi:MAG TPA: ABC transporter substrate-binding protein, partial [Polyangiaceae bacterium]|nr:ABC transporter substrate-binding protein [Polyangiaceae bacterium]